MRRQVAVLKTLDRYSEETLYFNIQVEKRTTEEVSQFCAYSGLPDAADTSKEYAHVIPDGSYADPDCEVAIISDSCSPLPGLFGGHKPAPNR